MESSEKELETVSAQLGEANAKLGETTAALATNTERVGQLETTAAAQAARIQELGEVRKEAPLLESLEAVTYDDRGSGTRPVRAVDDSVDDRPFGGFHLENARCRHRGMIARTPIGSHPSRCNAARPL